MTTILGVLSDTHVPDKTRGLHPQVLPILRQAGVSAILHAGDISTPTVLEKLESVAPVYAVRGNRDIFLLRQLPKVLRLDFEGVSIVLTHGHGGWKNYLVDRAYYELFGYNLPRYRNRLLRTYPHARVIVFGHTHFVENYWVGKQLVFNPGTPRFTTEHDHRPSLGLLHLNHGEVRGEIIRLE